MELSTTAHKKTKKEVGFKKIAVLHSTWPLEINLTSVYPRLNQLQLNIHLIEHQLLVLFLNQNQNPQLLSRNLLFAF